MVNQMTVHDLRAINDITLTPVQSVPNPYVALASLTPEHKWFSVIDLANVFFCIPMPKELRPAFAFTYNIEKYQYTRFPEGFLSRVRQKHNTIGSLYLALFNETHRMNEQHQRD